MQLDQELDNFKHKLITMSRTCLRKNLDDYIQLSKYHQKKVKRTYKKILAIVFYMPGFNYLSMTISI